MTGSQLVNSGQRSSEIDFKDVNGVLLFHDNATVHKSWFVLASQQKAGFDILNHSQDLLP